jgi:hypothetical protein
LLVTDIAPDFLEVGGSGVGQSPCMGWKLHRAGINDDHDSVFYFWAK